MKVSIRVWLYCVDMTHVAARKGANEGNEGTQVEEDRLFRPGVKSTSFYCNNNVSIVSLNDFLDISGLRKVVNAIECDFLYRAERQ